MISATLQASAEVERGDAADGKSATADFTEGLLRAIVQLTADQQLDLVQDLAGGRINKNKFKAQAEAYRTRNAIQGWVRDQLGDIDPEIVREAAAEVMRGAYDAEWVAFAEQGTGLANRVRRRWLSALRRPTASATPSRRSRRRSSAARLRWRGSARWPRGQGSPAPRCASGIR